MSNIDKVVCSCTYSIHGGGKRAGGDDGKHKKRREGKGKRVVIKKQVTSIGWVIQTDVSPPLKEAVLLPNQVDSRKKVLFYVRFFFPR